MSPFDATVVEKLKEINMVCLGKTNCDEFAMGSTTANSAFGKTYNPWDKNAVPGGSSGGASSCVAARIGSGRYRYRHRRLHPPAVCFLRRHRH